MKKQKIGLTIRRKKAEFEVYKVPWYLEWKGLMFVKKEKAKALLFEFQKPVLFSIHSYFVFFPFVAIWLDKNKKIIDIRIVEPQEKGVLPSRKFKYLIEVPFNSNYDGVLKILVGERKI